MKRLFCAAMSILMTAFLSGCLQDTIVIHVKTDGSGTIEETFLLSNSMLDLMESIAGSMGGPGKEDGVKDNKAATKDSSKKKASETRDDVIAKMAKDAEKRADTFGAAVRFISAKPVRADTASGCNAIYAFEDISQVRVNQNPGAKMDGQKAERSDSPKEEYLLFKFTKGPPAKLIVTLPPQKDTSGSQETGKAIEGKSNEDASAQSPEMMKNIFQDMKVKIAIQFEGTIKNTNASYRDGSTVTLIEMDIGKLMTNSALFKQVLAANPLSIGETKALFKSVEGLKFETNNPVTVEFE